MYRLSLIISEIYNKYLPLAEKDGIILNLDFSDTTKEIADPERVKKYLDEHLSSTLRRTDKGEVTIGVDSSAITITDSATTLSHTACALLSNKYIDVTSRVGFGTTVKIFFKPRELAAPAKKPALKIEGVSIATAVDNTSAKAPVMQGEVKVAAKQGKHKLGLGARLRLKGKKKTVTTVTKSKPAKAKVSSSKTKKLQTKTNRQLAAAARKADKEVKRIAKKVNKQTKPAKKANKLTLKSSKTKAKTQKVKSTRKTTAKRKIELS